MSSSSFISSVGVGQGGDFSGFYVFPASPMQKQLWFLAQLEPDTSPAYNVITAVRVSGEVSRLRLQRALNAVVDRHESLRTGIAMVDGEPQQVILPSALVTMSMVDCSSAPDGARTRMRDILEKEQRTPFALGEPPLLRATLVRLSKTEHVLVVAMHHVICDGWSAELLFQDIATSYGQQAAGEPAGLDRLPLQYADYVAWQQDQMSGDRMRAEIDHWSRKLAGMHALDLPTDNPRPAMRTVNGAVCVRTVPAELRARLEQIAERHEATLFMVLLTAFAAILARDTGTRDVPLGTPVAGRTHPDAEQLIGCFANTLVLRCQMEADPAFPDALRTVKEVCLDALAHQEVPLARLVEELRPPRDLSRTPLFQVMFSLQNTPGLELQLPGLRLAPHELDSAPAKFELWLFAIPAGSCLRVRLEYNADLFGAATADRLLDGYVSTLARIAASPEAPLWDLTEADGAQRDALVARRPGAGGQVYVRGNPVVLSEVEAVLAENPEVAEAYVQVPDDDHDSGITGWLVRRPSRDPAISDADLMRDVASLAGRRLAQHAVPSSFAVLEELPRKPDGAIDRTALEAMRRTHVRHSKLDDTPPGNPEEEAIAAVFREVLEVGRVGVHANFFALGGHSLLAAKIIDKVRANIGVLVPVRTFFRRPTVAGLAEAVAEIAEERRSRQASSDINNAVARLSDYEVEKMLDQLL